jgi:hypothetical protein
VWRESRLGNASERERTSFCAPHTGRATEALLGCHHRVDRVETVSSDSDAVQSPGRSNADCKAADMAHATSWHMG